MASRGSGSRGDFDDIELEDRDPRRRGRKGTGGSKKKPLRGPRSRVLRTVAMLGLGGIIAALLAVTGVFLYFGSDPNLPSIKGIGDYHPPQITRIVDREDRDIGELGTQKRTVVPYERIPKVLVQALVASEDADFWKHEGIDYSAVVRAVLSNVREGRYAQGFSTITQQVVKLLLLTPEKSLRRKIQEVILARQLSKHLTKEEILAIYLNQAYFGHGRYGCEEAARFFFGKSVSEIDTSQAALLAGIIQIPEKLSPYKHPEAAKNRQRYVLDQMAKLGYLDRRTAQRLVDEPIKVIPERAARSVAAPEVVDGVRRVVVEKYGKDRVSSLGTIVKTTVDARLQEMARAAVERGLEDLDARQGFRGPSGRLAGKALERHRAELAAAHKGAPRSGAIFEGIVEKVTRDPKDPKRGKVFVDVGGALGAVDLAYEGRYAQGPKPLADRFRPGDLVRVRSAPERSRGAGKELPLALELGPQAAMVVMDPQTHEILALVGGYGYQAGWLDRSQRALRQPGSTFKPFVFAAAIDSRRYTAASVVNDAPEVYDLWKPQNYEKEKFLGPVRLRVALAQSINTIPIKILADVGIPAVRDLASRAGIVTPISEDVGLAMALGANSVTPLELANAFSTFVSAGQRAEPRLVTALGGEVIPPAERAPAINPETAYVTVSLMRSVIQEGTAQLAAKLGRPVAGKTGTSTGAKDAWFVGFTPDLLAAVWVGFDDGKKLGSREAGGKTALPIWVDFMTKALVGRPMRDFQQPPGVVVTQIDGATGLRPAPGAEGIDEVFLAGTAPTEVAPAQGEVANPDQLLLGN